MRGVLPWLVAGICLIGMVAMFAMGRQVTYRLEDANRRETSSTRSLELAQARVRELEREVERQHQATAAAAAARAATDSRRSAATSNRPAPVRISLDDMRSDPAFANAWKHMQLRSIQRQYGDAIAGMKLSPDTEAKLRSLLVERNEQMADARESAGSQSLTPKDMFAAEQSAMQDATSQIKALIGEDGYAQLQQATQVSGMKMMVTQNIGMDLAAAGVPLNAQQTYSVAQAYATAFRTPGMSTDPDPATGLTPRNLAVYNTIAPSLSPEQLSAAKDSLLSEQQQQQFFQQQREKAGATDGRGVIFTSRGVP